MPAQPQPWPPPPLGASIAKRTLPDGTVVIFLTGEITLSHYSKFLDVADGVKTGIVILDSIGGDSTAPPASGAISVLLVIRPRFIAVAGAIPPAR